MKRQYIAVLFAALFFSGGAVAQSRSDTASAMMEGCRNLLSRAVSPTEYDQGKCVGAIAAIVDTDRDVCPPKESIRGQAVRIVVAYIDDRAARLNENFNKLAQEALRSAWPCR